MIGEDTYAYRRYLPHLQKSGKTYFVTFCTRKREILSPNARDIALACCLHDHRLAYWLDCAVVMPDHVHMIFTPYEQYTLAMIMNRVKDSSSHAITKVRGRGGHVWQREYFDRIVRASEDLRKKCEYVCENPGRSGLGDDYRWIWRSWIEGAAEGGGAPLGEMENYPR